MLSRVLIATDASEASSRMVEQAGKEECRAVCNDVFRHVLHPTDFSKTSERAYQYLEHVVKETHCAVTLLHVK